MDTIEDPHEKIKLINKNLAEVLNPEIVEDVILKQKRPLIIYWGTATTGRPHAGYFVPVLKLGDFLRAGCQVKILLADVHGLLEPEKTPSNLVKFRAKYYEFCITELLRAVHVPIERLEFVLGSSYQLSEKYNYDKFLLCTKVTEHDARKAGSEVVKQADNPVLSGLIYPLMQALDEEYLGVDAQFGGVDQRKIFALAMDALPKIGYKQRAHLMNPMVPSLKEGGKMSASDPDSKIDLLDPMDVVEKKLKKSFAAPRVVEGNGLLSFIEYVLLPAGMLRHGEEKFVVEGSEGNIEYTNISKMHEDYASDVLTPQLLKKSVTAALKTLLEPIQAAYQASEEWQNIEKAAYPSEKDSKPKKEKKKKGKGTKYPGSSAKSEEPSTEADGQISEGVKNVELGTNGS